jgi:uncharacterized membrane protein
LTLSSILLIVASALLHSFWNFLSKKEGRSVEFFFWVFVWGVFLFLPVFLAAGFFPLHLIWARSTLLVLILCSGLLETIYFICLIEAYRRGDLSYVYPVSRSSPLFTQLWAFLFIGEALSAGGLAGIGLVMIGVLIVSWTEIRPRGDAPFLGPSLLALGAALASSIYSVIDKVGIQMIHPLFYAWILNVCMAVDTGIYLCLRKECSLLALWRESKKEMFFVAVLLNGAYFLVLLAMQMSKVSYVVAFRQVGAIFGALMGILLLKEPSWKTRITGGLVLAAGLVLIGLSK